MRKGNGPKEQYENTRELIDMATEEVYPEWLRKVAPSQSGETVDLGEVSRAEAEVVLSALVNAHNRAVEESDFGMLIATNALIKHVTSRDEAIAENYQAHIDHMKQQMSHQSMGLDEAMGMFGPADPGPGQQ